MELLNKPIKQSDMYDIINAIYGSNRMIEIIVQRDGRLQFRVNSLEDFLDVYEHFSNQEFTILSITPIIPTYSVGDKVLVLATGETRTVEEVSNSYLYITLKWDKYTTQYHRSEIAKLPN